MIDLSREDRERGPEPRDITALHCPYYPRNPYQDQLFGALTAVGVRVQGLDRLEKPFRPWRTWLNADRPDVLHLHWTPELIGLDRSGWDGVREPMLFLADLLRLRRAHVGIVWTVHNLWDHKKRRPRTEFWTNAVIGRLANALIVHCPSANGAVARAYRLGSAGRKVAVIPHGTYVGCYPDDTDRATARTKIGLDPDAKVFLYLGRIREYKGVSALLEAFNRMPEPGVRLVVAGRASRRTDAGSLRDRAEADPRIHLVLDYIADKDIQTYLHAADAMVLPYADVLTSGSAILGMSFGKPIIAPAIGCLPDLVGSDGGILYDPGEPEALRRALVEAMRSELASMGKRNAALTREPSMSWHAAAEATRTIYEAALRPRKRRV